jgi:uncharacterized membrane protein
MARHRFGDGRRPDRARAVGAAVGRTPVPIIVPCHRAVGATGELTGYLGGLPLKRALLDLEASVSGGQPLPAVLGGAPAVADVDRLASRPPGSAQRMLRSAAALGAVSGMRTFGAWTGLALRGRVPDRRLRAALLVAAAGEMAGDKSPWIPPRSDPAALVGRVISGALAGRLVGGARGARLGAATAAASTYASQRARALLGERLGLPDPVLAAAEDALVVGVASIGAGSAEAGADEGDSEERASATPSPVTAVVRGLLAAAVGTAAMTSVQAAYLSASGGEPSSAPGDVGRKLIDVPRDRRAAFNQAMHILYGTSWGAPLGLVQRSRPVNGLLFGAAVWGVSLVELPLLDVAPPLWRQDPAALARDLAFHLVYGAATAAVLHA